MAIYSYKCVECGKGQEVWQSISSYSVAPKVPECHGPMRRELTFPMVTFDTAPWAAFRSPIDGAVITSRAERNEHMAKHGVVPYDEVAPDFERKRKERQKAATADLKDDLIAAVHKVEAGYKPQVAPEAEFIPT